MPAVVSGIIAELIFRHSVALLLHASLTTTTAKRQTALPTLLAVRSHTGSRRLPRFALARRGTAVVVVCRFLLVGERAARGFGPTFAVQVVEFVDAAAGLLAVDVDV